MVSFSDAQELERYEYVSFAPSQVLDTNPCNGESQNSGIPKFMVNNAEVTHFDWYNANLGVDFKINRKERRWE